MHMETKREQSGHTNIRHNRKRRSLFLPFLPPHLSFCVYVYIYTIYHTIKKSKYLGTNLIKEAKHLYTGNSKMLLEEAEIDGKTTEVHGWKTYY